MKTFIANAFSLSMLDRGGQNGAAARIPRPVCTEEVLGIIAQRQDAADKQHLIHEVVSAVGHADTAAILSAELGGIIPPVSNRVGIKIEPGDIVIVAQLIGPYPGWRLPEGATTLPEGAKFEWWVI